MDQEHDNVETDAFGAQHDPETGELLGIAVPGDEADDEAEEPVAPFVPVQPDMLLGEMRDHVVGALKRTPVWKGLDQKGQTNVGNEIEQACRQAIQGAVRIAAGMGLDAIEVTISKPTLTDKRQIEAKILSPYEPKTWAAMPEHGKRTLVFADAETLMGARALAVMKDQPGLFGEADPADDKAARDAAEQGRLLAGFKPTDDAGTLGAEAAKVLGEMLPPAVRAAADRGRACRMDGGACKVPSDLEGKPAEVNAFVRAWEAADREGDAAMAETPEAPAVAEPASQPKRRGRRTTVEERVAARAASVAGAKAPGTYEPA